MSGRGRAVSAALLIVAALASAPAAGHAQGSSDKAAQTALATAGAAAFQNDLGCASCHFKDSTFGPPLEGVAGHDIASVKGFLYSAALKAKAGNWTDANLDAFLADPQGFAPGAEMDASVQDPIQRREVIAYLKTLK
jgi:cytochrome c